MSVLNSSINLPGLEGSLELKCPVTTTTTIINVSQATWLASSWFAKSQASSLMAQSSLGSTFTGLAPTLGSGDPSLTGWAACTSKQQIRLHRAITFMLLWLLVFTYIGVLYCVRVSAKRGGADGCSCSLVFRPRNQCGGRVGPSLY